MPASLSLLPSSAATLLAPFSVTYPIGAGNLVILMVVIFLALLGLTMWVGRLRRRGRGRRRASQ